MKPKRVYSNLQVGKGQSAARPAQDLQLLNFEETNQARQIRSLSGGALRFAPS